MHLVLLQFVGVQVADQIQLSPLLLRGEMGIAQIAHRWAGFFVNAHHFCVELRNLVGSNFCSLIDSRQKGAAEVLSAAVFRRRIQRDKTGQIVVFGSQSVHRPRSQ